VDFTEARGMSGSGISWTICKSAPRSRQIIIIIINRFVWHHEVITSEALGPGSVLVSRERTESLGEEECV